jgi:[ribosomal protein S5]-alanine N-acetyltransferase
MEVHRRKRLFLVARPDFHEYFVHMAPEPMIVTNSLSLREFETDDAQDVYRFASDPEVLTFSPWGMSSLESTKIWTEEMIRFKNETPRLTFEFAICEKTDKKVIGTCRLGIKNTETREGYIGFTLSKDKWRRGYATEVARALLEYGFGRLDLHRIYATSAPLNAASHRVLEKSGLVREGLLRKNVLLRGAWRDSVLFAILEEDWAKTR